MQDFDEIIRPLLEKKYRVTNIDIKNPREPIRRDYSSLNKAVITPLGAFISVAKAAEAHGVTSSTISSRLGRIKGYEYA